MATKTVRFLRFVDSLLALARRRLAQSLPHAEPGCVGPEAGGEPEAGEPDEPDPVTIPLEPYRQAVARATEADADPVARDPSPHFQEPCLLPIRPRVTPIRADMVPARLRTAE